MNMLNINLVKEKFNLAKNYFRKFSLKQKIIGISTILVALVISAFFIFFYESEEDRLKNELEVIFYRYLDRHTNPLSSKFLSSGFNLNKHIVYKVIQKNKKSNIYLYKKYDGIYEGVAEISSSVAGNPKKDGQEQRRYLSLKFRFELVGSSELFDFKNIEISPDIYIFYDNEKYSIYDESSSLSDNVRQLFWNIEGILENNVD